jgi:hypothetical protein
MAIMLLYLNLKSFKIEIVDKGIKIRLKTLNLKIFDNKLKIKMDKMKKEIINKIPAKIICH